jgi:hypothetical protein
MKRAVVFLGFMIAACTEQPPATDAGVPDHSVACGADLASATGCGVVPDRCNQDPDCCKGLLCVGGACAKVP